MTAAVLRFRPGDRVIWWAKPERGGPLAPLEATVVEAKDRRVKVAADGRPASWVDDTILMHPTD